MRRSLLAGLAAAATMLVAAPTASATETRCTGILTGTFDTVVVPENSFCRLQSSVVHGDVEALRDSELIADSSLIGGDVVGDGADSVFISDVFITGVPFFDRESVVAGSIVVKGGGGPTGTAPVAFVAICGTELPHGDIEAKDFSPSAERDSRPGSSTVLIGGLFQCGSPEIGGLGGGNTLGTGSIEVSDNTINGLLTVGGPGSGNTLGAGSIELKANTLAESGDLFVEGNQVAGSLEVLQTTSTEPFALKFVRDNTGGGALECLDNTPPFVTGGNSFPEEEGQCD